MINNSSPPSQDPEFEDILSISGCPSGCEHEIGFEATIIFLGSRKPRSGSAGIVAWNASRTVGFLRFGFGCALDFDSFSTSFYRY